MQHLEHDMDDLFRKAAEDYSLKTSESKWDSVASQLNNKEQGVEQKKTPLKRRRFVLAAILLLLFLFLGNILVNQNGNEKISLGNKKAMQPQPGNNAALNESTISKKTPGDPEEISSSVFTTNKKIDADHLVKKDQSINNNELPDENDKLEFFDSKNKSWDISPVFSLKKGLQSVHIKDQIIIETFPTPNNNETAFLNPIPKNRGLYWGFTAGPQLNEVKSQGMNKTGFDIGLLAGYRFSKSISFESGFHFATKYYYSEGKHFKMAPDPSMPPNMTLMSLKGNSKIIEIPVKFKYDLINNGKNNLFSSAGITSYLLTKETNNYHAMVNGSPMDMDKSYKDVTNYTAATFYFSAGYEHSILKRNKIRIEPYLQIPLKGIGVGKMPVTSAGLHLGITWERK